MAIGSLGLHVTSNCDEVLDALTTCTQDKFWRVRHASICAVGSLGSVGARALPTLLECLESRSISRNLVASKIALLGGVGVSALVDILDSKRCPTSAPFRVSAAFGLVSRKSIILIFTFWEAISRSSLHILFLWFKLHT